MEIHVVQAGQTLNAIGREYGVTPELIARYNGIAPPYGLAVGQSLLILRPTQTVTVEAGDTLSAIAARTGLTIRQLLRNNPNLQGLPELYPSQVLVIAFEDTPSYPIEVSGYTYDYVNFPVLRTILPYATFLAPFTYGITQTGGLVYLDDEAQIALAREYGVRPLMHLSTLTEDGNFSTENATLVLSRPELQQALAAQILQAMQSRGYEGLDVDFEFVEAAYAESYAEFIGLLRGQVNAIGQEVLVALAPKTSDTQAGVIYQGHNYRLLGENADAVLLMTYEWGYTYGPPMAVAPAASVQRVLDYAVTQIPPDKIFMGFPNYAYNWTLPFQSGISRADSISNETAVALALQYGAVIQFDETAQTPYFHYTDANGAIHEVWFEDARSCYAKYRFLEQYGFRGIGYWNFMRRFTVGFSLLNAMYRILPE